ncbi:MAG: aspartyl-tRNA amidotransferase [Candidatus Doudnabacteria bacterium CG10_big_fil_rev_8_21_14_0_10_41_10]|uniref:Aspartyl-tRNA amidotransferase n=1 Tax=Candidatus Doudnabacteria bacterium CG10_big_fil_rev_8_21_14_0_10_41_10 TaxID=1974551 RepID=A0A2H0VES6_9BACT|nr:MAG: aspartyl-tRNA amidotransferase [Candidatus Doudnabacteria bacterium CG10_big_fil_rev_8_21_14_0_10_41_10]
MAEEEDKKLTQSETLKKIQSDLIVAMKAKDQFLVGVLRFVKYQLDTEQKNKKEDMTEQEVIKVLRRKIKQSEDSKKKFQEGGRADLSENEQKEIEIISKYLPQQLSEKELVALVDEAIAQTAATSMQDFGKVMGSLMKTVSDRADGNIVKNLLENKLKN